MRQHLCFPVCFSSLLCKGAKSSLSLTVKDDHTKEFKACCHRLPTLSHLQCYTTDISDLPGSCVAPNQMGYIVARYQPTPEDPQAQWGFTVLSSQIWKPSAIAGTVRDPLTATTSKVGASDTIDSMGAVTYVNGCTGTTSSHLSQVQFVTRIEMGQWLLYRLMVTGHTMPMYSSLAIVCRRRMLRIMSGLWWRHSARYLQIRGWRTVWRLQLQWESPDLINIGGATVLSSMVWGWKGLLGV